MSQRIELDGPWAAHLQEAWSNDALNPRFRYRSGWHSRPTGSTAPTVTHGSSRASCARSSDTSTTKDTSCRQTAAPCTERSGRQSTTGYSTPHPRPSASSFRAIALTAARARATPHAPVTRSRRDVSGRWSEMQTTTRAVVTSLQTTTRSVVVSSQTTTRAVVDSRSVPSLFYSPLIPHDLSDKTEHVTRAARWGLVSKRGTLRTSRSFSHTHGVEKTLCVQAVDCGVTRVPLKKTAGDNDKCPSAATACVRAAIPRPRPRSPPRARAEPPAPATRRLSVATRAAAREVGRAPRSPSTDASGVTRRGRELTWVGRET